MKAKSFTIMEVLISLVIITILASLSIFVYDRTRDVANQKVCGQNQLINNATLKMFIYEYNAVPGSLGEIPNRFYDKAFAKIMDDDPLFILRRRLCFAILNLGQPKMALAQSVPGFLQFAGTKQSLVCPADTNGFDPNATPKNYSYAINGRLFQWNINGYTSAINAYKAALAQDWPIICDSDNATFGYSGTSITAQDIKLRHGGIFNNYSLTATANKNIRYVGEAGYPMYSPPMGY